MKHKLAAAAFFGIFLFAAFLIGSPAVWSQQNASTASTQTDDSQNQSVQPAPENGSAETEAPNFFGKEALMLLALKLAKALFAIFLGMILYRLLKFGIYRINKHFTQSDALRETDVVQRIQTLTGLAYWLGTIAIIGTVIFMCLENFGFNVAPLLAGAGIVGLAFGFGGQYLIRDVINGIFILVEGQYHINDVVKIGELSGLVEGVNLRLTRLRDLEGRVIYIPNGEIKSVINFTQEWSRAVFDVGVAYKEDVDRVMEVIKELGKEMRKDAHFGRLILADLEMLGVDGFADSQVTIKFFIKTLPIKQWEVAREFRRRLKNRFDELGIEIPFPHRTVYWGTGGDNDWMRNFFSPETVRQVNSSRPEGRS